MDPGASLGSAVLLAFWTVLLAELVGDKVMYTLASLTLRFRAGLVFAAFALASGGKMLAAVLLGRMVVQLQSHWTYALSAAAFFVSAILIWREEPVSIPAQAAGTGRWFRGALVCFTSFFLTEWGDPGQIAAAALALRSHAFLGTWLGGTLALGFKGAIALTVGVQLRHRLPQRMLRVLASASCCVLGVLALGETVLR